MGRYIDGFEDTTDVSHFYEIVGSGGISTIAATYKRFGSNGLRVQNANNTRRLRRNLPSPAAKVILGFGWNPFTNGNANCILFSLLELGSRHLEMRRVQATGAVQVTRNGTVLWTSANDVAPVNEWHHWQVWLEIHDSAGVVKVYRDLTELANLSALDTRNGNTSGIADTLEWGSDVSSSQHDWYLDDVVVLWGTEADALPGDLAVYSLAPNGAGTHADFTPSAGANYQNVDDATPDDDTTYNASATAAARDTFALSAMPVAGTVKFVAAITRAKKSDAGSRQLSPVLILSGNTDTLTAAELSTGYVSRYDDLATLPGSAALTVENLNALESGYEIPA